MRRRAKRIVIGVLVACVILIASLVMIARTAMVMSLPVENGRVVLAGLQQPASIERDAIGIPTIKAKTLLDAAHVQGFVHAQERFFQMDVTRRYASGRLSEIVGARGLPLDRKNRAVLLEKRAREIMTELPTAHRELLEAYAEGVNAGLEALDARPPEYFVLGVTPQAWRAEDSVLAVLFMFRTLSMGGQVELSRETVHGVLSEEVARFLFQDSSRFDQPMNGANDWSAMPVPGESAIDLRKAPEPKTTPSVAMTSWDDDGIALGSNNWAVAGSRTAHGGAMIANDMHLGLHVPNTWFRARLEWGDQWVEGVTLPGAPSVVAGSNGNVAWGFTNLFGDFEDYVRIEMMPDQPGRYRTPEGSEAFTNEVEEITVKGGMSERLELQRTRWGVVTEHDHAGTPLVLKWIATEPGGFNLELFELMQAKSLEDAVTMARRWYGPPQNVMIADAKGRIAWAVSGWFPKRNGFDGSLPTAWSSDVGWFGAIDESQRPGVTDPPEGMLFSANNRTLAIDQARSIGANWAAGYRARRIGELLHTAKKVDERDMLSIQLDTRVEPMDFYRELVLNAVKADDADALVRRARELVNGWNGRADVDQAGYRILKRYAKQLELAIIERALEPCREKRKEFRWSTYMKDEPLRRILEERPANWLPSPAKDWDSFLREQFSVTARALEKGSADEPAGIDRRWGESNRAAIRHALSQSMGGISFLDMPSDELAGDPFAVRVASPRFGASERMVVSPGRESTGIMHMPCGQSGHPMSRHYRDGHSAWVNGEPTAFGAGAMVRRVELVPAGP